MKSKNRIILSISRYLLLILFVGYYSSITMFFHTHVIDGHIITHSHPYRHLPVEKSPYPFHSHPSGVITLIQELHKTSWLFSPNSIVFNQPLFYIYQPLCAFVEAHFTSKTLITHFLRGPPSCMSII